MARAFAMSVAWMLALAAASGVAAAADEPAAKADAKTPDAQTAAAKTVDAKPDLTKGGAIAQAVCAACHGPDGNATGNAYPKIAGQNEVYLAKQLHNFKAEGGSTVPTRQNPIMAPIAAALSDTDIRNVTAYYATQAYKPASAKNASTVELGQKIWRAGIADHGVPACAACHGPNGAGIPIQYPRLAGQWGEYNEAQLNAFRSGTRHNNVAMMAIASRLSEADIKAVADYAAGLR